MNRILLLIMLLAFGSVCRLSAQTVAAAEYFVDTDPGVGNGTPLPVMPGDTATGSFTLDVTGLPPGFHNLYIRGRDTTGQWGFTHRQNFYVKPTPTPPVPPAAESITAAEYFVDTDPGMGNGTPLPVMPGDTATGSFTLDVTGLVPGFHNLYVRGRNAAGDWGFTRRQNFYVKPPPTPPVPPPAANVVAAEFFIETDPGPGNGIPVPIPVPGDTVNGLNVPVTITQCLNPGAYQLYLRGRDATGQWGFYASTTVTIQDVEAEIGDLIHQPASACGITGDETFLITVNNTGDNILPAGLIQLYIDVSGANTGNYGPFTNANPVPVGGQALITATGINLALVGTNIVTASFDLCNDAPTGNSSSVQLVGTITGLPPLALSPKVFLQGPYVAAAQLMHDSLRVQNLIPLTEPYTGLTGFTHTGGGGGEQTTPAVLAVSGSNAVVDWVFLELRSANTPSLVLATHSALVQRDGDVVDVDGVSPVVFNLLADTSYFLAVRHRNHLGVQVGEDVYYPGCVVSETNFRSLPPEGFYAFNGLNAAQKTISGTFALWAGNGRTDFQLKYNGSVNDRNAVLSVVGLTTPNNVVPGYELTDYNLDGLVKYNGSANDRNVLLGNVGISTPSAILWDQVAR